MHGHQRMLYTRLAPILCALCLFVPGLFGIVFTDVGHAPDVWTHVYRISGVVNGDIVARPVSSTSRYHSVAEENVGGAVDRDIVELSIEHWLVIPYITGAFRQDEKNLRKIYDKIITPTCLKDLPNQHALPVRNQWMINQSNYALAYITHPSGGAWQTFQFALQQPHISVVQIGAFQKPS